MASSNIIYNNPPRRVLGRRVQIVQFLKSILRGFSLTVSGILLFLGILAMQGCDESESILESDESEAMLESVGISTEEAVVIEYPESAEITYYHDEDFTRPLNGTVYHGQTYYDAEIGVAVYTKIAFPKDVPIVISDTGDARPIIFNSVESKETQYRMKSRGSNLQSGDAKPYKNTKHIFICKFVPQFEFGGGIFSVYAVLDNTWIDGDIVRINFPVCDQGEIRNREAIIRHGPDDFIGQVFSPNVSFPNADHPVDSVDDEGWAIRGKPAKPIRSGAEPVADVIVTIMSGPRHGESTVTNQNGWYMFSNVKTNELHLRVEKDCYEPKEVIVHRFHATRLANGDKPNYHGDPQKNPGNILIGRQWPDEVRFILRETLVVYDLLLYIAHPGQDVPAPGLYDSGAGTVIVQMVTQGKGRPGLLSLFAHEIAHAHQHALISVDGGPAEGNWETTPEGKAFAEARQRDFVEVGKTGYDGFWGFQTLKENAAETCAYYWSTDRWGKGTIYGNLKKIAPNRFKWAEEWLIKK